MYEKRGRHCTRWQWWVPTHVQHAIHIHVFRALFLCFRYSTLSGYWIASPKLTKKGRLSLLTHARFEDNSVFCIRYCYLTYRDERKDPELEMRRQLDLPDLLGCISIGCIKFCQSQKESTEIRMVFRVEMTFFEDFWDTLSFILFCWCWTWQNFSHHVVGESLLTGQEKNGEKKRNEKEWRKGRGGGTRTIKLPSHVFSQGRLLRAGWT